MLWNFLLLLGLILTFLRMPVYWPTPAFEPKMLLIIKKKPTTTTIPLNHRDADLLGTSSTTGRWCSVKYGRKFAEEFLLYQLHTWCIHTELRSWKFSAIITNHYWTWGNKIFMQMGLLSLKSWYMDNKSSQHLKLTFSDGLLNQRQFYSQGQWITDWSSREIQTVLLHLC